MKIDLKKKIHPLITYPLLVFFSFYVVLVPLFLYVQTPAFAQGFLLPFEGRITQVDYVSCVCGLSVLLTIEPTTESQQGKQASQMLFFYGAQLIDDLFGINFSINGIKLPYPRVFAAFLIWYAGPQKLLGNYLPYSFPCVEYVPPYSCQINGYYPAILFVGTSLY
jgi:hypothetical protein